MYAYLTATRCAEIRDIRLLKQLTHCLQTWSHLLELRTKSKVLLFSGSLEVSKRPPAHHVLEFVPCLIRPYNIVWHCYCTLHLKGGVVIIAIFPWRYHLELDLI